MKDKIQTKMVNIIVTKDNCARLHEIIRELIKLKAIDNLDADLLMACCEVL